MIHALCTELILRNSEWTNHQFQTLYFGGGTPSVIPTELLQKLISTFKNHYHSSKDLEITLECNPENCSATQLQSWKNIGISRLSMGVQSFNDSQLQWMNRIHSARDSKLAIQRAKDVGFDELNIDLIYGLPNMTLAEWDEQLDQLLAFNPEHISAYCLTVESKTSLAKWVQNGKIQVPSSDEQAVQFERLVEKLGAHGYEQYEISNFCRNQHYSKHNTSYWKGELYAGIGPSAHGFTGTKRYWNVPNNTMYLKKISMGELPQTIEELSIFDQFNEKIMIGLRTKWGVSKKELLQYLELPEKWLKQIEVLKELNLLVELEGCYFLTSKGRLVADNVASELFILE